MARTRKLRKKTRAKCGKRRLEKKKCMQGLDKEGEGGGGAFCLPIGQPLHSFMSFSRQHLWKNKFLFPKKCQISHSIY